jgi:hypothetical protein
MSAEYHRRGPSQAPGMVRCGRMRAPSLALAVGLAAALLATCGPPPKAPPPARDLDAEARAAAETFLHCYERDGAECRHQEAPYRSWHALRALLAVRDHSPVALLEELPRALDEVRDDAVGRKTLIGQLTTWEPTARAGQCHPVAVRALGASIDALRQAARARVEDLGLGDTAAGGRVGEVSEAAAGLRETREVRLACASRELHLVLAPTPDGGWHPVQLGDAPVAVGAGTVPEVPPTVITVPDSEAIDPWLPFGEDQL